MSTRTLRWGLLGTGRINRALITPLRASPRNQLVAVASRSIERAAEYARQWNIPRHFGSYEAMLSDPEIDVIYNSLPNGLHAEWTVRAAEAGKHVLCEKPLAVTLEGVDAMADAARRAGVVVAEAFMYRHHPQTLHVKKMVDAGTVGKLVLVRGSFSFLLNDRGDVRMNPELGGGALWDLGCYPVSYARYIVGEEPEEAFAYQVTGPTGVDDTLIGQLRFPGSTLAQFDCSFRSPDRAHMEIVGSTATLRVPQPFKPALEEQLLLSRDGSSESIPITGQELYLGEVEDMADAILLGKAPRIPLSWSWGNVATLLALYESARLGRPVPVPHA